jgi:probable phosphoglycerate mutase
VKRLVLVRHGETAWNADHRLQGQTDIALSDHGRAQAAALAPLIARLAPDVALTSDLGRAAETSALLGRADAMLCPALRERNLGVWEGCAIAALPSAEVEAWRAGRLTPPGGEPWDAFCARVDAALRAAVADCARVAVATCHGGVIRAAIHRLVGIEARLMQPVGPGSVSIVDLDGGMFRLKAFNLRPPGPDRPG